MAVTFSLGPNPKWAFFDSTGITLGSGQFFTFRSLNKTEKKSVFQDPAGAFAYPNPAQIDADGTLGPIYFEEDSANPDETYYIEVRGPATVLDPLGPLIWSQDNYLPATGGSGGSVVTTALDLRNLILNNVMIRNIGTSVSPLPLKLKLAPSAHAGLAETVSDAGPDIFFLKSNTSATDTITFTNFTLGSNDLIGDVTPVEFVNYESTSAGGGGETFKNFQYPITSKVQNLNDQEVTITLWAKVNSGANNIILQFRQFFGDGAGASADVIEVIDTIPLTSSWTKYVITHTVPSASTKNLGGCRNDGLFFIVQMPLSAVTNIDFIKASCYLGTTVPEEDFHTNDAIDSEINSTRTGQVVLGFDGAAPLGFVPMDDGTIGNPSSGATTRANFDTFPLYNLLYNNVIDTWAPVSGGRTADPVADYDANKTLTLTRTLGRALAAAGAGAGLTSRALGEFLGEEDHQLTIAEMPAHDHPGSTVAGTSGGAGAITELSQDTLTNLIAAALNIALQGGDVAHNTMQPTAFMNTYIKL